MNKAIDKPPVLVARRAAALLLCTVLAMGARADVIASSGWSRATVPGAMTAVGYLVLTNTGTESHDLLKITSPVCDKVMLHRSSVDAQGMARMWPIGSLSIKAGETIRFEPNGMHVMFMELTAPFVAGTKVPLQLQFEGEKEITVLLEVRPLVPDAAPADHSKHKL